MKRLASYDPHDFDGLNMNEIIRKHMLNVFGSTLFNEKKLEKAFNISDSQLYWLLMQITDNNVNFMNKLKNKIKQADIYNTLIELYPDREEIFNKYRTEGENPAIRRINEAFYEHALNSFKSDAKRIMTKIKAKSLSTEDRRLLQDTFDEEVRNIRSKNPKATKTEIEQVLKTKFIELFDRLSIIQYTDNAEDAYYDFALKYVKDYVDSINEDLTTERDVEKSRFELLRQVHAYVKENLQQILPKIKFRVQQNGTIEFSWSDSGQKNDGNQVFRYIITNPSGLYNYLGMNESEFLAKTKMNIRQYFNKYTTNDFRMRWEDIHLRTRQYIIQLNQRVLSERNDMLLNNDDKPSNLDVFNGVDDKDIENVITSLDQAAEIDFNPSLDCDRSKPIIIAVLKEENKFTPVVLYGDAHSDIINRNLDLLSKSAYQLPNEDKSYEHVGYAYLVGNVAFIDIRRGNFIPIDRVVNILKNEQDIEKVYTCLYDNMNDGDIQPIYRLAKRRY